MNTLTLTPDEILEITGFSMPCKQLEALRQQGFTRAHRARDTGRVILERAHYIAVCAGQFQSTRSALPSANVDWMKKRA